MVSWYKHPGIKISNFNNAYLTPLLAKILQEEKTCLLISDFNIIILNTDIYPNVSDFYDTSSSNFFAPYLLQPTRLARNSKILVDNIFFLNSIEFNTFCGSGNLTLQISDHLSQFLILKDFYHESLVNSNNVFERNCRLFSNDEFKNDFKKFLGIIIYLPMISPQVWLSIRFLQYMHRIINFL